MKNQKSSVLRITQSLAVMSLLVSCAKERAYETVYRPPELLNKSMIATPDNVDRNALQVYNANHAVKKDEEGNAIFDASSTDGKHADLVMSVNNSVYLYVPSVVETPRKNSNTRPYWMGDPRMVTFKFTEKALVAREIETDPRYQDNIHNFKPIAEIPITHHDYRCKLNKADECTNEEEEVDDTTWQSKKFFKPDFNSFTVLEQNFMPLEIDNLFYGCHSEVGAEVTNWKIEADAINIEVQRTFKTSIVCLQSWDDVMNRTFTANYHYSFVKLNTISSAGYKSVLNPQFDFDKFGFFESEVKKLTADNRYIIGGSQTKLLNRFNPEKKSITYYLSDNFYKSKYEKILEATKVSVDVVNESFKKAGVDFKINLDTETRGKKSGDLRNNMIVMVEDPLDSGLLGYGPSVGHPLTGEIVQARTVMYYGNMAQFISRTFDDLVDAEKQRRKPAPNKGAGPTDLIQAIRAGNVLNGADLLGSIPMIFNPKISFNDGEGDPRVENLQLLQQQIRKIERIADQNRLDFETQGMLGTLDPLAAYFDDREAREDEQSGRFDGKEILARINQQAKESENMLDFFSKNNVYHADVMNFQSILSEKIEGGLFANVKDLKYWDELSNDQKQYYIDELMPLAWITTLIHEIGHNIGLRHNFEGSEDKDNWYSEDELAQMHIKRAVKYSSVMDYAYSEVSSLPVMGKYDIAALRFGYGREVEVSTGQVVKIESTLEDMQPGLAELKQTLKDYKFCTDDGVALQATCNRFDEGTNYTEIADHYMTAYQDRYKRANMRGIRLNFSELGNLGHLIYTYRGYLLPLRKFFETLEIYSGAFNDLKPDPTNPYKATYIELVKINKKIAKFLMDVVKTPDATCMLEAPAPFPGFPAQKFNLPLSRLRTKDCQSFTELPEGYKMLGQFGKSFNNLKTYDHEMSRYNDQIDIRGFWIDKIVALDMLLSRTIGISSFDDTTNSFMSLPIPRETAEETPIALEIYQMIEGLYNGKFSTEVQVVDYDKDNGGIKTEKMGLDFSEDHIIEKTLSRRLNRIAGLRTPKVHFTHLVSKALQETLPDWQDPTMTGLAKAFKVYTDGNEGSFVDKIATNFGTFYAKAENILALKLMDRMRVGETFKDPNPVVFQIASAQYFANPQAQALDEAKVLADYKVIVGQIIEGNPQLFVPLSVDPEEVKKFLADPETATQEARDILSKYDKKLIELVAEIQALNLSPEASKYKLADTLIGQNYGVTEADIVAKSNELFAAFKKFRFPDTIVAALDGTLNTPAYYESVLNKLYKAR